MKKESNGSKIKQSKRLKVVSICIFALALFAGIFSVMAASGRINVSEVPVLDSVFSKNENTVNSESGKIHPVPVADSTDTAAYTSICDVKADNGFLYLADATGKKVLKTDTEGKTVATFNADVQVNSVALKGNKVYVMEGGLAGKVKVCDQNLNVTATIEVEHTPCDMVFIGNKGYVANQFSGTISVLDLDANKVVDTVYVDGIQPIALTTVENQVFIACQLPDDPATGADVVSANVCILNTESNKISKTLDIINGAGGVKGICTSPDGKTVYVAHVLARYAYPTTQLDRGWINTNAVTIIDTDSKSVVTSVLLDDVDLGAANPWAIACTEDGAKLVVTISGTNELEVIDIAAMNRKINAVKSGKGVVDSISDIPDYIPFLADCKKRIDLTGKEDGAQGARSLSIQGNIAYVGFYFSGSVDVVNLTDFFVKNLSIVNQPEADAVRIGEKLFADGISCYQQWESCLSCHPESRADGFNWDNLNDGLGNAKNAKSMLYSHRTPPVMVTGIRATAESAVQAGMKFIQYNVLDEKTLSYIDEYLKSLMPEQSPYLNRDGSLTESAKRGEELFETYGCGKCHSGPNYTDMKTHNVGSNKNTGNWENRVFDTPSLVEIWRTAPYMHDGRFTTLKECVAYFAKNLTDAQLEDLTNYVGSIGNQNQQWGVEEVLIASEDGSTVNVNKLVAGGCVTKLMIRRQLEGSPEEVKTVITLKDAKGNVIDSKNQNVTVKQLNRDDIVSLSGEGISIPKNLESGATLTVSIQDVSGNTVASDWTITY